MTRQFNADTTLLAIGLIGSVLLALLLIYISAFLFLDDVGEGGSTEPSENRSMTVGLLLVGFSVLCFLVVFGFASWNLVRERQRVEDVRDEVVPTDVAHVVH